MRTCLVLDALEQALWTRRRDGRGNLAGLVHHTDAGSQYTSIAFTERLAAAGVSPSVGTVGDAYDNALAESVIGLFKTELIKPRGPWRTAGQVEIATLEYVDWFNHRRLYEACGDIPPAELEAAYYSQNTGPHRGDRVTNLSLRTRRGGSSRRLLRPGTATVGVLRPGVHLLGDGPAGYHVTAALIIGLPCWSR
jgi:putative transposase